MSPALLNGEAAHTNGHALNGLKKPHDCPAFGKQCTPLSPLGATMVSAEGACAAYYSYGRHLEEAQGQRQPLLLAETSGGRHA